MNRIGIYLLGVEPRDDVEAGHHLAAVGEGGAAVLGKMGVHGRTGRTLLQKEANVKNWTKNIDFIVVHRY